MAFIIGSWIVAFIICMLIGSHKGKTGTGVALGLLLGWIGVIIMACLSPSDEVKIQRAQEQMNIQWAAQQRMLAQPLPPQPPQQGRWPQQRGRGSVRKRS